MKPSAASSSPGDGALSAELAGSRYYNADMAPTTLSERRWGM